MLRNNSAAGRVRWVFVGTRWVAPWLVRLVWFLVRQTYYAGAAWVRLGPQVVQNVAYHWQQEAVDAGLPTEYEDWVYYGTAVITIWAVLVGWVAVACLTVWLLRMIVRLPLF